MGCTEAKLVDKVRPADLPRFFAFERRIRCVTNIVAQNADRQWTTNPHHEQSSMHVNYDEALYDQEVFDRLL